mmetsp:Transcript_6588/g.5838  ORF Transcript_6588/g.5838 Transcript_6588/m.5838 type:complete len:150 (-) Transcript_6588:166-615(-)
MLAIAIFIFAFITISNAQLGICGTATVGAGLFGCTLVNYNLPNAFDRCVPIDEMREIDPEANCAVQLQCDCSNPNQPGIVVQILDGDCGSGQFSSTRLGRDQACTPFNTCRGNFEARISADEFNKCCQCGGDEEHTNNDKHDFMHHIFN